MVGFCWKMSNKDVKANRKSRKFKLFGHWTCRNYQKLGFVTSLIQLEIQATKIGIGATTTIEISPTERGVSADLMYTYIHIYIYIYIYIYI